LNDDDLALATAVFQAAAGAFRPVEPPDWGSRSNSAAQFTLAFNHSISVSCLLMVRAPLGNGGQYCSLFVLFYVHRSGNREAGAGQGVRSTGAERDAPLWRDERKRHRGCSFPLLLELFLSHDNDPERWLPDGRDGRLWPGGSGIGENRRGKIPLTTDDAAARPIWADGQGVDTNVDPRTPSLDSAVLKGLMPASNGPNRTGGCQVSRSAKGY